MGKLVISPNLGEGFHHELTLAMMPECYLYAQMNGFRTKIQDLPKSNCFVQKL